MKLRIKYISRIGFFAQVKHGIFSPWKKIGKHISGYGLYPAECIEHPMETKIEALERAKLYEQWFVNGGSRATYIDV
jgi:hypothetical protein